MSAPSLESRVHQEEILDGEDLGPAELHHSLRQVDAVNRWLGGDRSLRSALADLRIPARRLTLLDVGAGSGRTLRRLLSWGRRPGADWQGVALDRSEAVVAVARGLGGDVGDQASPSPPETETLRWVRGDALHLPLPDGAVDVALCTLTLHHFRNEEAVRLLEELGRVARIRVVVSDLERGRAAWWGARLLAATVWRGNRITRHDGPLSVRRAFTMEELRALGTRAGLGSVRVRRHHPWRLAMVGDP